MKPGKTVKDNINNSETGEEKINRNVHFGIEVQQPFRLCRHFSFDPKMKKCPFCGEIIYQEYDDDPGNLTGKYYFCCGNSGGCRATFPLTACVQVLYEQDQSMG